MAQPDIGVAMTGASGGFERLAATELVKSLRVVVEGLVGPGVVNLSGPSTGSGQEDPIELDTGLMDWEMGGGDPAPLQDDLAPPQDNPALPQDNLALASYITASDASDPTMVHMYTSLSDREQELVVWFPLSDMERRVSRVYSPSIINPAPSMSPTPSPASLVPPAVPVIYYLVLLSSNMVPVIYSEVQGPGCTPAATSSLCPASITDDGGVNWEGRRWCQCDVEWIWGWGG
ncbi:hypothetical protein AcV5_001758 [Taiwanofungus camphoratus]|nr:hypothetical protein AcV5_001758 [Antrodia cinnamomea]